MIESLYESFRFRPALKITKLPVDDAQNSGGIDQILGATSVDAQGPHDVVKYEDSIWVEVCGKVIFGGRPFWNERWRTFWSVLGQSHIYESVSMRGRDRFEPRDVGVPFDGNNICTQQPNSPQRTDAALVEVPQTKLPGQFSKRSCVNWCGFPARPASEA